jgi:hypothetical protein
MEKLENLKSDGSWIFIGESKLLELELSETCYQKKPKIYGSWILNQKIMDFGFI